MATDLSETVLRNASENFYRSIGLFRYVGVVSSFALILLATAGAGHADAQSAATQNAAAADPTEQTLACGANASSPLVNGAFPVPFGVGERMEYDVKFSSLKVGTGVMEVRDVSDVRGKPSWHTALTIHGKAFWTFNVDILLESWFDVQTLASRKFHQDQKYPTYSKNSTTLMFPERGMYKEDEKDEQVSVTSPLDDGSFIYFFRTLPLEIGQTYSLPCYFKPDKNPVKVTVSRRETITTPAGTFKTIVLQPRLKAGGIFGEKGKAEVWLTDDSTRMMVQLKSELSVGSINLYLAKYKLFTPAKP